VRTNIPCTRPLESHENFSQEKLDEVLRRALDASASNPGCVEVFDQAQQRFLFLRDKQVYSAGVIRAGQFETTTIREFLLATARMSFPGIARYELNTKILHSLLILFQKKPALRVLTSLVDLDEVLDRIEAERKSCIVSAARESFLAILRYERGTATALCHEESAPVPREASFRDEFLVKIYTISAEQPLTISLFEDLLVTYAEDAKTIPLDFTGRFEDLYLSRPPVVSLQFKGREVDHRVFDQPRLNIGRTPDNDIVIDNLAVSRLHAVLEEEKGVYYVRDCDSLNGTVVNGQKVGRARLEDGDTISIGKHTIVFRLQGGRDVPAGETIAGFDQTVIITPGSAPPAPAPRAQASHGAGGDTDAAPGRKHPRLVMHTDYGTRVIELREDRLVIGRDLEADVAVEGLFVAREHAEIIRKDGRTFVRRIGGLRRVRVDGRAVREAELKNQSEIRIASGVFIYEE